MAMGGYGGYGRCKTLDVWNTLEKMYMERILRQKEVTVAPWFAKKKEP